MRIGAGITLLVGSLLLLRGKRRAGMVVTATGAALAVLEEQELVAQWWNALPGYLDGAERLLDTVSQTVDDLTAKRDKIMAIFGR
jgi:ABC-type multidrug transport system fused ATPase/permease subunit